MAPNRQTSSFSPCRPYPPGARVPPYSGHSASLQPYIPSRSDSKSLTDGKPSSSFSGGGLSSHWDLTLPVSETLTNQLIACGAKELQEIFEIWDKSCEESRQRGATPRIEFKDDLSRVDNISAEKMFQQIINKLSLTIPCVQDVFRFLDLGCRPDSFASFILNNTPLAFGVGISLPQEMSLYQRCHRHYLSFAEKFRHYFLDISKLDMRSQTQRSNQPNSHASPGLVLKKPPEELDFVNKDDSEDAQVSKKFSLVIIDNQFVDSESTRNTSTDLFFISQLLLALQCLVPGGTLVVRLTHPESVKTAKFLYMFDILASTVASFKPREMVGDPGSFYAVAQGIGYGPHGHKMPEIIEELRKLWGKLLLEPSSPGPLKSQGVRRGMLESRDLDFLIYTRDLKDLTTSDYVRRLAEHGEMVWTRQLEMILHARCTRPKQSLQS
ncbi:hypothetical protein GYMLUDRAFT_236448 [Collybiopsis luxurians FD-317 M1]|nr:hypothetical protein GYMLUDRAFT_236448 [Collybiopsis luxurians FD-317 M1]